MELVGVFSFLLFFFRKLKKKNMNECMNEGIDIFSCISLGLRKKVR